MKYLKLDQCEEKWDNIKPNNDGFYCDLCSKTIIDFTKLSPFEISKIMKNSNERLCIRINQKQLNEPIFDFDEKQQSKTDFPYKKIAASLLIATTLAGAQPSMNNFQEEKVEFIQTNLSNETVEHIEKQNDTPTPEDKDFVFLDGFVMWNGIPIENAKISFVHLKEVIVGYSDAKGSFLIKIPKKLVDDQNLIYISYDKIDHKKFEYLEETSFILTKNDFEKVFEITATKSETIYGGVSATRTKLEQYPKVFYKGIEVDYVSYFRSKSDPNSTFEYKDKKYLYFTGDEAIAVYGENAPTELYILFDKD